jgi:hypothetical protein
MDARGWTDRPIIDTEHTCFLLGDELTEATDALCAAFTVQDLVLKRTLMASSQRRALDGALPHKLVPRCDDPEQGECRWGTLDHDGQPTLTVRATGLLWSLLDRYSFVQQLSGMMDNEEVVWVLKFSASDGDLFVFFKPFGYDEQQGGLIFNQETAPYTLVLDDAPASAKVTRLDGSSTDIPPAQDIRLNAENSPKFLEVRYAN